MADDRPDTPPHSLDAAHHGGEEPHTRDLNVPLIVTIGLISCILLLVIGIGTVAWFRHEMRQEQWAKVIERENPELRQLNLEAEARIREIDVAIERVAQRYAGASAQERGQVRSPVPVEELDESEQFEPDPEEAPLPAEPDPEAARDDTDAEDPDAAAPDAEEPDAANDNANDNAGDTGEDEAS